MTSQPSDATGVQDPPSLSKATSTHDVSIASCIDPVTVPRCDCGRPAGVRTSHTAANPNRQYFGCSKAMGDDDRCMFFQWCDAHPSKPFKPPSSSAKISEELVEASELQRDGSGLIKAGVCQSGVGNGGTNDKDVASKRNPQCFECGQYGHLARECTYRLDSLAHEVEEAAADADVCFKCKTPGHWARDCPMNAAREVSLPPSGDAGGDVCFKCNQPGHWARECPSSAGKTGQGKASQRLSVPESGQQLNHDQPATSQPATELYPCMRCGETGHWAKNCTKAWRDEPIDVMGMQNPDSVAALQYNKTRPATATRPSHQETNKHVTAPASVTADRAEDVCFKCHLPGHWASECPTNVKSNAANETKNSNKRDLYPCLRCGKTGHWAKDCSKGWRDEPLDVMGMNTEAVVIEKGANAREDAGREDKVSQNPTTKPPTLGVNPEADAQGEQAVNEDSPKETVDVKPISSNRGNENTAQEPGAALVDPPASIADPAAPDTAQQPPVTNSVIDPDPATDPEQCAKKRSKDATDMPPPKNQCVRHQKGPTPRIDVKKLPLSMRGGGGWDVRKE